jgi:hypothetical protein
MRGKQLAIYMADPFYRECLIEASDSRELMVQFDRLYGHNLSRVGGPGLDMMIDHATGRTDKALDDFTTFVKEVVFERLTWSGA